MTTPDDAMEPTTPSEQPSWPMGCFLHPDRAAVTTCARCQRGICAEDQVDSPVGPLCPPDAEALRQAISAQHGGHAPAQERATGRDTPVTVVLLAIVAVLFVLQALPETGDQVTQAGVTFGPAVAAGQWWRLVTGGFLHFGLIHVGFNGYMLFQLGRLMEGAVGSASFAGIYAAGLLGGTAGALLLSYGAFTAGASGAIFGLLGAALVLMKQRGMKPFSTSLGRLLILNLVFTFAVPGVSIGGHVGGLLAGGAAMLALGGDADPRTRAARPAGVAAVMLVVAWAIGVGVVGALG